MKIGHLSDIHVLKIEDVSPSMFLNKRLIGGLNLLLNRGRHHRTEVVELAFKALGGNVDHIVVSGDLSNLGLESEFHYAKDIFAAHSASPKDISVVPGNHDYYVPGIAKASVFEEIFKEHQSSDLPELQNARGYPWCRLMGPVALIGLNTGIASGPMMAVGRVDRDEIAALEKLLVHEEVQARTIVITLHHPLLPYEHTRFHWTRRLIGASELLTIFRQHGVALVLHGHNHHHSTTELPHTGTKKGDGILRICEVGSASVCSYDRPEFGATFNTYTFDESSLQRIDTHLYESVRQEFVHWKTWEAP